MHKRILAITLCLVMVSAIAATGAVSATTAGKSNIRSYDVYWWNQVGKATLDLKTGHLVINVNLNKERAPDPWQQWHEGQHYYFDTYSSGADWLSFPHNANYEIIIITITADGTGTVDTYIDPWYLNNDWYATYVLDYPDTYMQMAGAG